MNFAKNGVHNAHLITRAKTILALDRTDKKDHLRLGRICEQVGLSRKAVYDIRKAFLEADSVSSFLTRKKRATPPVPAKNTGEVEAHVIEVARSTPPEGYARWPLQLLANKAVELSIIDKISFKSVQRIKKTQFKPHLKAMWCTPSKQNAEFVAHMEDVLSVYARPYDEKHLVVCMDEKPFQLLDDCIPPITMSKDCHKVREDCEYERKGTCSIFIFTEPLAGWRYARARPQRTSLDWSEEITWLLDTQYPTTEKVVLVIDNLNTHHISSLYKAFPPQKAFELYQRLEIHHTPKHGSWLDVR